MQPRLHSLTETCCNVGSGVLIAMLTWRWVIEPIFEIDKPLLENLAITLIFTGISLVRGYAWRRIWARKS